MENVQDVVDVNRVDGVDYVDLIDNMRAPRQMYVRENYFESLDEQKFFERFRLTKNTTLYLLNKIEEQLEYEHNRNNSIAPIDQLLLTLRTFATGGHLLSIADFIQADKSTISRLVTKVTHVIASLANEFIYMPRNQLEVKDCQNKFYDVCRFPRVIGAIDGTHIRIQSPGGVDAEVFRNRKGYFSINVQICINADFLIQDIVARWPGSAHDATIFNNSRLKFRFQEGEFGNGILLGDSGYMNTHYLMTPFLNTTTRGQENYNRAHVRTRVKVENVIGIWKRRFPILAYGCRLKLESILPIIVATAVLHNVARLQGEPEPPNENNVNEHELQQAIVNGDIPIGGQENNQHDDRLHFVQNYFNN
ncbi:hypothetical protein RI129_003078 [Pyrocoelia pectoralis]|uniref:Putative nuclease HARBI1 n=1 Tax=Pyrocoelia pectoralis TaxID=417401 RepID=A0AAN7ZU25_9COLE